MGVPVVNAVGGRIAQATIDAVARARRPGRAGRGAHRPGPALARPDDAALPVPRRADAVVPRRSGRRRSTSASAAASRAALFDFVAEDREPPFPEAVEWLADRYGVEVEREDLSPADRDRLDRAKRVDGLLDDVTSFYERYLERAEEAQAARDYLAERGVSAESIARFRLGFAPSDWDRVARAAQQKGYPPELLLDAGVSSQGRRGPIDRFRGRITFPLCDARGRVRGFGARVMPGGEGPKYLNSPESEIFKKSRILYGLHLARPAIAKRHRAIVVEGYTDVIALHAAGFEEAVAAMGTSLTEDGVRELRRLADAVVLCFDADAAGQEAALRGMAIAERSGLRVRIVALPAGEDPADILARGPEAFEAALDGRAAGAGVPDRPRARAGDLGGGPRRRLRGVPGDPGRGARRARSATSRCAAWRARCAWRATPPRRSCPAACGCRGRPTRPSRRCSATSAELAYHRLLAACLVARGAAGRRTTPTPLAAWVARAIGGRDAAVPDGLEGDAATVLAYAAEYADGDDGRAEARTAVENLRVVGRIWRAGRPHRLAKGRARKARSHPRAGNLAEPAAARACSATRPPR